jgi:hypothetical protein
LAFPAEPRPLALNVISMVLPVVAAVMTFRRQAGVAIPSEGLTRLITNHPAAKFTSFAPCYITDHVAIVYLVRHSGVASAESHPNGVMPPGQTSRADRRPDTGGPLACAVQTFRSSLSLCSRRSSRSNSQQCARRRTSGKLSIRLMITARSRPVTTRPISPPFDEPFSRTAAESRGIPVAGKHVVWS